MGKGCSQQLEVAASVIGDSFFADHGSGQSAGDMMCELLVAFMPLPPSSTLAVCRALMHIASPHILLAAYESSCGTFANLFTGPILHVILRNGDADKGLQLRFLALQVKENASPKENSDVAAPCTANFGQGSTLNLREQCQVVDLSRRITLR